MNLVWTDLERLCLGQPQPAAPVGELSGVGFFKEAYITVKPFGKRAILLLG
jgi:hypothetical protein